MNYTTDPFAVPVPADLPFAFSIQALAADLTTLVDQRKLRGIPYPLVPFLTIAILAKLCGHSRVEAIADWAHLRAAELAHIFGLSRTTMPHARTWGHMLAHAVDPTALATVLGQFFQPVQHCVGAICS